jgi:hypothetical protein
VTFAFVAIAVVVTVAMVVVVVVFVIVVVHGKKQQLVQEFSVWVQHHSFEEPS